MVAHCFGFQDYWQIILLFQMVIGHLSMFFCELPLLIFKTGHLFCFDFLSTNFYECHIWSSYILYLNFMIKYVLLCDLF